MTRVARSLEPGGLYHIVCRFIDGRFELDDELRSLVLDRAEKVFARSDWTLLTYALMSSHMHWAVLAGESPSSRWTRALNGSIARAIQAARRSSGQSFGAVFAGRPREMIVDDGAATLLAYIHNNPVRAGVVASAEQSDWTGHRAMIGLSPGAGPANARRALEVAGFCADASGRAAFHQFVVSRAMSDEFAVNPVEPVRNAVRNAAQLPVELRGPRIADGTVSYEVVAHPATRRPAPMRVDVNGIVEAAARRVRAPLELTCSKNRSRLAVESRRLALIAGRLAGLPLSHVAAALGMSLSAANYLIATVDAGHPLLADARAILQPETDL